MPTWGDSTGCAPRQRRDGPGAGAAPGAPVAEFSPECDLDHTLGAGHVIPSLDSPRTLDTHVNDQIPPPYVTALVVAAARVSRHVASRSLRELGMRVLEADGAEEALDVFRISKQPIDLVLLDVVMPETDGVELADQILAHRPGQRIIFMSAYPAEVLAEHGLQDLDVVFLAKPYTMDELQVKVRQAMDRPPSPQSDPAWRMRKRE